jgi:hypothetical protein
LQLDGVMGSESVKSSGGSGRSLVEELYWRTRQGRSRDAKLAGRSRGHAAGEEQRGALTGGGAGRRRARWEEQGACGGEEL